MHAGKGGRGRKGGLLNNAFSFPKVYPFCFRILSELMRSTHRHTHTPDVQNTQGEGGALISSYLLANSDQIFFFSTKEGIQLLNNNVIIITV